MAKAAKKEVIEILTREQADAALQQIGRSARAIAEDEKRTSDGIDSLRMALVQRTARDRETIAELEDALKAWAEDKKSELFAEPRSIDLNWGRVGFRWTPWKIKILNKLKVETVIEKLRANKMSHLIRVQESIDKEKALNYDNEVLAPLGMKKTHEDEFWYEVKKEEVR